MDSLKGQGIFVAVCLFILLFLHFLGIEKMSHIDIVAIILWFKIQEVSYKCEKLLEKNKE